MGNCGEGEGNGHCSGAHPTIHFSGLGSLIIIQVMLFKVEGFGCGCCWVCFPCSTNYFAQQSL